MMASANPLRVSMPFLRWGANLLVYARMALAPLDEVNRDPNPLCYTRAGTFALRMQALRCVSSGAESSATSRQHMA